MDRVVLELIYVLLNLCLNWISIFMGYGIIYIIEYNSSRCRIVTESWRSAIGIPYSRTSSTFVHLVQPYSERIPRRAGLKPIPYRQAIHPSITSVWWQYSTTEAINNLFIALTPLSAAAVLLLI